MGQLWDAAIAAAAEQPPADLPAAIAEELIALWSDLGEAMRRAGGRSWSVECEGLVVRIVMLSRLTAATSWEWIPEPLLANGTYQGILQSAGIAFTAPSLAEIYGVDLATIRERRVAWPIRPARSRTLASSRSIGAGDDS